MRFFNPPHEAEDQKKVEALVEAFRCGKEVTPVVVYGDDAYTGSHRIAAHAIAVENWESGNWDFETYTDLPVVEIDDEEFAAAYDEYDINITLENLLDNTSCDDLRSALEGQLH